jgi:hypothetical protein
LILKQAFELYSLIMNEKIGVAEFVGRILRLPLTAAKASLLHCR